MSRRTLTVQFLDTWHVGTGQGQGAYLDAVVARDVDALPYVPGKMLRGMLRDAVEALAQWQHLPQREAGRMFGVATLRSDAPGRVDSPPGCVTVSDARLPVHEREVLAAPLAGGDDPSSALRAALFLESFQTAVDGVSGTARSQSLRGVELVVPLTLQAEIGLACTYAEEAAFWQHLTLALPLVRSIGAMKTRGHGRVALAWAQEQT